MLKLLFTLSADWLINRRHCQQTWQAAALTIREKINNAIQDMPPTEEITALLTGTCMFSTFSIHGKSKVKIQTSSWVFLIYTYFILIFICLKVFFRYQLLSLSEDC